jgi:hypothetical protein
MTPGFAIDSQTGVSDPGYNSDTRAVPSDSPYAAEEPVSKAASSRSRRNWLVYRS